jgi:hypothetical protein
MSDLEIAIIKFNYPEIPMGLELLRRLLGFLPETWQHKPVKLHGNSILLPRYVHLPSMTIHNQHPNLQIILRILKIEYVAKKYKNAALLDCGLNFEMSVLQEESTLWKEKIHCCGILKTKKYLNTVSNEIVYSMIDPRETIKDSLRIIEIATEILQEEMIELEESKAAETIHRWWKRMFLLKLPTAIPKCSLKITQFSVCNITYKQMNDPIPLSPGSFGSLQIARSLSIN